MLELLGIPDLGDPAQVRAARPEGRARRRHRRPRLAGLRRRGRRVPAVYAGRDTIPTRRAQDSSSRPGKRGSGWPRLSAPRSPRPSPIVEDEQGQLRARQGISREVVSELSKIKGEPDWMAEKRLEVAGDLRTQADPDVGPRSERPEPRRPRALLAADGRALQQLGRRAGGDEADLRGPRHPAGRARAPRGRRRRVAPGAGVRGPQGGVRASTGSCSARWTPPSRSTRSWCSATS